MFRNKLIGFLLLLVSSTVAAQPVLTENEAVKRALANNKNIQAASLQVKQQQELLKSAFNIPNPEFFWESPTGNFYTPSITQSFEFPTVYSNQHRLQKQQVAVAQKEKQLTEAELKYRVKVLYLEAQFADSLVRQLYLQDTLYEKIKLSAIRQFNAGQIDYLQQIFTETQYGEIHNLYQQAVTKAKTLKAQLQWVIEHAKELALKQIASLRLAGILLDEKNYAGALKLLDKPFDPAFAGLSADLKGDVLTAQGKQAEARAAYQIALDKTDQKSVYRKLVQMKLDALGEGK